MINNILARSLFLLSVVLVGCGSVARAQDTKAGGPPVKARLVDLDYLAMAFVDGNVAGLDVYKHSSDRMIADLAWAAYFRLRGDGQQAMASSNECINYPVESGLHEYFHVVCLWVRAGMEREAGENRDSYLSRKEGCEYLKSHQKSIASDISRKITGRDDVMGEKVLGCERLGYFDSTLYLPKTSYSIDRNWSQIDIDHGFVTIAINGKKVKFLVDTGDSEITINCKVNKEVCADMKAVGLRYTTDDFSQTYRSQDRVAKHVHFGPLDVYGAYLGTTDNAPSTIGFSYLRRLGGFVLTQRYIRNQETIPDNASQCTRLKYDYGAIEARQLRLKVDVETTVGNFKLWLDTGSTSGSNMPETTLFLYERSLANHPLVRAGVFKRQSVTRTQHGSIVPLAVDFFHFSMNGSEQSQLTGLISPKQDYLSEDSDGVLGGALTDQLSMWLDFRGRRVCFSRLR
ncbi:hypothetical protein PY254_16135 [Rhodanobacter sp. AS-Z3]|uniref:hypothetical protein n=1 Tax=Rhodanobacter sp. AS-Z3 TaxID=3031330 RepID=UPI002478BB9A|nr:hypothetical protein [Rhodanobacter sp. AS-Z3]WEN14742.1 hypothetical protein PY254_16135 [Rhodanobacter sp. AS-Z3]